jgi:outer membrane murein-binding lipoprotein Lpp
MTNPENLTPPSVSEMLRITGTNTAAFMDHIAEHVEKLEAEIVALQKRVEELEATYEPKGEDNV